VILFYTCDKRIDNNRLSRVLIGIPSNLTKLVKILKSFLCSAERRIRGCLDASYNDVLPLWMRFPSPPIPLPSLISPSVHRSSIICPAFFESRVSYSPISAPRRQSSHHTFLTWPGQENPKIPFFSRLFQEQSLDVFDDCSLCTTAPRGCVSDLPC
jgi:hypothetical protein